MKISLILVVALFGCSKKPAEPPLASTAAEKMKADQVMFDVQQYITQDGVRRGLLKADTAYVYEDSGKVEIRKVHLNLFGEKGEQSADLTSRGGTLDTRTQAMVARGNVVLITGGGAKRIETEELHYEPNSHKVWSNVTTKMIDSGNPLTGDGFTSDDQMRNISVTHPRGRVNTGGGGGLKF